MIFPKTNYGDSRGFLLVKDPPQNNHDNPQDPNQRLVILIVKFHARETDRQVFSLALSIRLMPQPNA